MIPVSLPPAEAYPKESSQPAQRVQKTQSPDHPVCFLKRELIARRTSKDRLPRLFTEGTAAIAHSCSEAAAGFIAHSKIMRQRSELQRFIGKCSVSLLLIRQRWCIIGLLRSEVFKYERFH